MKKYTFLLFFIVNVTYGQICSVSQFPTSLQNGLVAYYPFCGNANDASGNGLNGNVGSGVSLSNDRFGNTSSAYFFNNTIAGRIALNNIPITLSSDYSFSYWQKMTAFNEGDAALYLTNTSNQCTGGPQIWEHNNSSYLVKCGNTPVNLPFNAIPNQINNWINITWTVSNGVTKLYENGVLIGTSSNFNWPNVVGININLGGLGVGAQATTFSGYLDDIYVYNRAISACEVSQLYNETVSGFPTTNNTFNSLQDTIKACGSTTTLDAGAGYSSYLWNTGATTQTISPTSSGFFKVTVTNASGCTSIDSSYLSLVKAKIVTPNTSICKGSNLTLKIDSVFAPISALNGLPKILPGLVAYYPFAGNTNDISGNGYNGTIVNTVTYTTDRFSNPNAALSLGSGYVTTNNNVFNFQYSSSFTVSVWVYDSGTPNGGRILSSESPEGNFRVASYGKGIYAFQYGSVYMNDTISLNQWNYMTYVYSNGTVKLYKNGQLKSSALNTLKTILSYSTPFTIGSKASPSYDKWVGKINQLGIYNRALSNTEIQQIYTNAPAVTWSTGATTNNIIVSPTQTTKYFVSVFDGITTCTDSVTVTVNDLATFNPLQDTVRVCGDSAILDAGTGYDSYLWSTGATTQDITVKQSGKIIVQGTKGACTGMDSSIVSIVKAKILTPPPSICKGGSVTLSTDSTNSGIVLNQIATFNNIVTDSVKIYYPSNNSIPNTNFSYDFWFNTSRTINLLPEKNSGVTVNAIYGQNFVLFPYFVINPNYRGTGISVGTNGISVIEHNANFFDARLTYAASLIGWHHCAVVYSNNDFSLYLDGLLVGSRLNSLSLGNFGSTYPSVSLNQIIGMGYWGYDRNDDYNGKMDELRHWNVSLTPNQIVQIYQRKLVASSMSECLLNLTFDQGAITNLSTNTNAPTITNVVLPSIVPENIPQIGNFSGPSINSVKLTSGAANISTSWSTGASTNSILVSPTQTTKYFVSVTDGITTCTDSVTVIVNDLGIFNPLQDTVRVCGDSTILDAGAGFDSYTWSTGATTQKITVKQSGKITLQVTKGACVGLDSSIVSIVKAKILTPHTTICKGGNLKLSIDSSAVSSACNAISLPANLQNGLVGYYPFCGNANDASGNGNNGIVNGATLTADRFGNANSAYSFNGNSFISVPSSPMLNCNSAISISCWAMQPNFKSSQQSIISRERTPSGISYLVSSINNSFSVGLNNDTTIQGYPPSNLEYLTSGGLNIGVWQYLVFTWDGATVNFYVNGILKISQPAILPTSNGKLLNSTMNLFIGKWMTSLSSLGFNYFTGSIDDVAIYNRALSSSEVQQLNTSKSTVSWSTGAIANSILVSPTQTTKYFVSVSDGITTCTDSVTVTIAPVDTSLTVLDPPSVCSNTGQVRLQAGVANGYQWIKNGVVISGATNQLYTATTTGLYKVFVTNSNGCVDSSRSVQITLNPKPLVSFTINKNSQCLTGNNFIFTNTSSISAGTVSYAWSQGDNTNATTTNVIKSYAAVGSYSVTLIATSINGCIDSAKATANVTSMPTVSITPNPSNATLCYGTSATLTASGASTYLWNSSETTAAITKSPTTTTTYTLIGTDANGCTATTSKTITVNALPTVSITPNPSNATICYGTSATLTASGANTYLWNSSETTAAITKSPITTTTYTVTGTDANGCTNTASQIITVNPLPAASIQTPASNNLCNGSTLTLTGSGGTTYNWYLNGTLITGASSNTYNASQAGAYTLKAVSASGCLSSISSAVTLIQIVQPTVNFSYDKNCVNSLISFTNSANISQSGSVNYAWDFGDGGTSTIANGTHTFNSVGAYTVKLTVTPTVCPLLLNSVIKSINIAAPQSNERYRTVNTIRNFSTPLSARNFGTSYLWNPSVGLNNPIINSPVFNYNSTVNYTIAITDNNGCVTTDSILLNVFSDVGVYVPKAFSPNGNGVNDMLRPILVGINTINFFSIYNRWGQILYTTQKENAGWDGTFKGQAQPIETYTWTFEGVDYKGNIIRVSGKSTLLR